MKRLRSGVFAAFIISSFAGSAAKADSPAEWEKWRRDVRAACIQAVSDRIKKPKASVDPFGSESYGLALVRGSSTYDGSPIGFICVYNKRSRAVEVSEQFAKDELDHPQ